MELRSRPSQPGPELKPCTPSAALPLTVYSTPELADGLAEGKGSDGYKNKQGHDFALREVRVERALYN